jgi:hypothetical protein
VALRSPDELHVAASAISERIMTKTWVITGANRGLGLEIARAALVAGDK